MRNDNRNRHQEELRSALRFAGFGMELSGFVLVLAGIGYLADRYFESEKAWGVVVGAMLGFTLGMIHLFQLVSKINKSDR